MDEGEKKGLLYLATEKGKQRQYFDKLFFFLFFVAKKKKKEKSSEKFVAVAIKVRFPNSGHNKYGHMQNITTNT